MRVTRVEETVEGRGSGEEDRLQVAQQVKFAAGLEQSSVVHPAARSPYSHPATPTSILLSILLTPDVSSGMCR